MKNTPKLITALLGAMVIATTWSASNLPLADEVAEQIAREILKKMTLEEKVSLCGGCATMYLNALPRVGIDREWSYNDCGHAMKPEHNRDFWGYIEGVDDSSTALPCISALASTWNVKLAEKHGHVMGEQMRARDKSQMLGPGINIMRNPLCGRNWEYMSEDPFLTGKMVAPLIKAVQSHGMAATPKHFCLNSQELNRFDSAMTIDDRTLNEIYLPAFKAAIEDGGALSIMSAYNRVNGTFCSENSYLQKAVLRERWGFKGTIITDWGGQHSCDNAVMNGGGTETDAGRNVKHLTNFYGKEGEDKLPLATAVKEGRIPEATVDAMVMHQLFVMAKAGFLTGQQDKGERLTKKHQNAALKIGEEAIILAKNEKNELPLKKEAMKNIVIFGQIADLEQAQLGSSCECHTLYEITFLEGLKKYLGKDCKFTKYPLGREGGDNNLQLIDHLKLETFDPNGADAFAERAWERRHFRNGKELKLTYSKNPNGKWDHNASVFGTGEVDEGDTIEWKSSIKAPESGEFAFMVEQSNYSSATIEVAGKTIVDHQPGKAKGVITLNKGVSTLIIFRFHVGPAANFCHFGWIPPSARGDTPERIMRSVEKADAILVFTGTTMGFGQAKETEGSDRPNMKSAPGHDEAIAEILSWKKPNTIVVMRTGSAIESPWLKDCPSLFITSYLGQEAGRALARTLFGDVNPSGKLTYSWPKRYADTPTGYFGERAYNATNSVFLEGVFVGYRWYEKREIEVDFPFGHGLSYTTFEYGDAQVKAVKSGKGGWKVTVPVKNTGDRAGAEVVQLYVAPPKSKVERPLKELKGFKKVFLKPGEMKEVSIELGREALGYWDTLESGFVVEEGEYEVLLGSSSQDVRTRGWLEPTH